MGTTQIVDKVDARAAHQIKANRIDDELGPVQLGDRVIILDRLRKAELVLEARTSPTLDRQAEDRGLALLHRYGRHARGG